MSATLASLIEGVEVAEVLGPEPAQVLVQGVTQDSRTVLPGWLYVCVRGAVTDGHDLAPAVVAAGATSLLVERFVDVTTAPVPVAQVRVQSTRAAVAGVAAAFWGHPSRRLKVVGVTGTDGKTTTTHLLAAVLAAAGLPCGIIGTLSGVRTTPEAPLLQAALAEMAAAGKRAVAMEVSSMALDQHRADAVEFAAAVFTNLSGEHLDYHGTIEAYFAAKASLFEPGRAAVAVINDDDPWGRRLAVELEKSRALPVRRFSVSDAQDLRVGADRSSFTWRGVPVVVPIGGAHNIANALAAAAAAEALGVGPDDVAAGLAATPQVPGRWETVWAEDGFTVIVDYAHTPRGLGQALDAARQAARTTGGAGRVLVVFGAGGDRDRAKRPRMGEVASRLADVVFFTTDNPRSEDPDAIIEEVATGACGPGRLVIEPDRERAIGAALAEARAGDIVLVAGKGHETGQEVGGQVLPFDDREVVARLLRSLPARRARR